MADSVTTLKGMNAELAGKMKESGITNTDHLLDKAGTPAARRELAKAVGIEPSALLELVNRADLSRIKGIGGVFADMLEEAGVDSVKELAHRRPDNLQAKLEEVNGAKKLSTRTPNLDQCETWVAEAKELSAKSPVE